MRGLYSSLFRYRSRPDRQPLEDFLTEALADIMRRMSPDAQIDMLDWCFRDARHKPDWGCLRGSKVSLETQVVVAGGIADLVLYRDERPMLVIENKTWSGFRDHGTVDRSANQMTTYCEWLSGETPRGAALLVTGTSDAPEGYHGGDGYAIDARAQVTWASLSRWLNSLLPAVENRRTWHDLAAELIVFIKEKSLSSEVFSQADLAAMSLALPTMGRWHATFTSMWSSAEDIKSRFLKPRVSDFQFNIDGAIYWQWCYGLQNFSERRAWVGLGVRIPETSNWYRDLVLPNAPHFIMILGSDNGILVHERQLPSGWLTTEEDGHCLFCIPIYDLPLDAGKRIDILAQWMRGALADAERIFSSLKLM